MKTLPRLLIIAGIPLLVLILGGGFLFRKQLLALFSPKPKKIILTYWGLFEPLEVMQPLIVEYQSTHPNVQISYQLQAFPSFGQYKKTLATRLDQDGGIDIARVHGSWVAQFKDHLAALPSSVMTPAQFGETFYPIASDFCKLAGNYYCLPVMYDGLALLYNKDLLTKAGLSTPPTTWEDFREAAVRLSQWEGNDPQKKLLQAGAAMGAPNVDYTADILGLMLTQSEVKIPDGLGGKAAQDVFSFFTNFVKKDKVWDGSWPDSVTSFSAGKVGMIFAPSFEVTRLINGDKVDFGVAGVPQIPTEEGQLTAVGWGNFWVDVVPTRAANQAEAWDFLRFLAEKESERKLFDKASQLRGLGFPYSRKDLQVDLLASPYLGGVAEGAPVAKSGIFDSCSGNPDYENIFLEAVSKVLAQQSAEGVLSAAQAQLQGLISRQSLGIETEEKACSLVAFGPGVGELIPEPSGEEGTPAAEPVAPVPPTPTPNPTPAPKSLGCLKLSATPSQGKVPLEVSFATRVSEPAKAKTFNFNFGDGRQESTGSANVKHTYGTAGTYRASVVAVASDGQLTTLTGACQATVSAEKAATQPPSGGTQETKPGFPLPLILTVALGFLLLVLGFTFH